MRIQTRTGGASLALGLMVSIAAASVWPRAAAAEETSEGLRQGLTRVADLVAQISPDAAGQAAALRTQLAQASPEAMAALNVELSRQPTWSGTAALVQMLAPLTTRARNSAPAPIDCDNPQLECPDTSDKCAEGQRFSVETHLDLFIAQKTFDFVAIGLEATCGIVGALAEDAAAGFCAGAAAAHLTSLVISAPADISDICGGGELEADILNAVLSQNQATRNEMLVLKDKLRAIEAIEKLRIESALAACTKISTLMLPEASVTGTTRTELDGNFLRAFDLVQARFAGAKRVVGYLSAKQISTVSSLLDDARARFSSTTPSYGSAFKSLCDAYQQLR